MGFGAKCLQAQKTLTTLRFFSPIQARETKEMIAATAPTSKIPEEREFIVDFGASTHRISKKRTDAQVKWILYGDPESAQRW